MKKNQLLEQSIKIISYNIHKGFNFLNTQYTLDLIKRGLKKTQADLLCLQEVCGSNTNPYKERIHPLHTQFEFIADGVWKHYAYGKNAVYNTGHHGNAILSKYPITAWNNLDLSTNRLEYRGLLHAIINIPENHTLHVMTSHLNLREKCRHQQIAKITEYIKHSVGPKDHLVLAGDFNDWRESLSIVLKTEAELEEAFLNQFKSHAKTFPSFAPFFCLDRIYYRNFKIKKAMCLKGHPWRALSDHTPVCAELSFV